jgi:hypothetical protein
MAGFVKTKGKFDGGDTIKSEEIGANSTPAGGTADRPSDPESGDLRFNTDTSKMEYYDGSAFVQFSKEGDIPITQDSFTGDGSTITFTSAPGAAESITVIHGYDSTTH